MSEKIYEVDQFYTGDFAQILTGDYIEKAYAIRFPDGNPRDLILRTDNGPQYMAETFRNTVKILGIKSEYIQKHTPEDNGDIESFHSAPGKLYD